MTGYPWKQGDNLFAADLNQAIANNAGVAGISTVTATGTSTTHTMADWMAWLSAITTGSGAVTAASIAGPAGFNLIANYEGSGFPAFYNTNRLLFARQTPAVGDYTDFMFQRATSFTGGTQSTINQLAVFQTVTGQHDACNNWNVLLQHQTNGTSGGLAVAGYATATRNATATDGVLGLVANASDQTGLSSSAGGANPTVGLEVDCQVNRADDGANSMTYGGVGVRKNIDVALIRNLADTTRTEVSNGIWFTAVSLTSPNATDANSNYQSAIGFGVNTQVRQVLDTRGAITPTGSSNPVAAVCMSSGHVIDFNGGTSLTSAPGRSIFYNSGSTRLEYRNGTHPAFTVSDFSSTTQWLDVSYNVGLNAIALTAQGTANLLLAGSGGGGPIILGGTMDNAVIGATTPAAASVTQLNLTTSSGPNIRSGAGAPSGTQPAGSIWLRTDGATGSRIYVSAGGGTWNAISGV